ncbi:hypothetical protein EG329_012125 [Mollisiaceae sp. DMI_Dod_QoI]|nr:hypothetical protein EG329_012125 [Helotiales sp. DMI_Dod_QoI]
MSFTPSSIEEISQRLEHLSHELQSTNQESQAESDNSFSAPSTPSLKTPNNDDANESDNEEESTAPSTNTTITPLENITSSPNVPPNKEIKLCTQTDVYASPKTQHFSREFAVFLTQREASTSIAVGQAQARYIDRACLYPKPKKKNQKQTRNKHSFAKALEPLNAGDSDGLALALQFFNSNGTLMSKHTHPRHPSSPFGAELNSGAVLVLSYLLVERAFRRRGMGRVLISELIAKAKRARGGVEWVFVKPGVIPADLEVEGKEEEMEEVEKRMYAEAVAFYRGVGFRRVGGSKWFCLAVDEVHASRRVRVEDDAGEIVES